MMNNVARLKKLAECGGTQRTFFGNQCEFIQRIQSGNLRRCLI